MLPLYCTTHSKGILDQTKQSYQVVQVFFFLKKRNSSFLTFFSSPSSPSLSFFLRPRPPFLSRAFLGFLPLLKHFL